MTTRSEFISNLYCRVCCGTKLQILHNQVKTGLWDSKTTMVTTQTKKRMHPSKVWKRKKKTKMTQTRVRMLVMNRMIFNSQMVMIATRARK